MVGGTNLVSLFLLGAHWLHPQSVPQAPVWDLPLFHLPSIRGRQTSSGDLLALSVSPSCLRWGFVGYDVTMWPNTAFVPKVLSHSHWNQPLRLTGFQPTSGGWLWYHPSSSGPGSSARTGSSEPSQWGLCSGLLVTSLVLVTRVFSNALWWSVGMK